MATITSNMGLTQPSLLESADITVLNTNAGLVDAHDHANGKGVGVKRVSSGVAASRPAFGNAGNVYFSTDTGILSLDTGAAWSNALTQTGTQTGITNKTFTSPHMTTPVVDSGGLTITAGGLTITAGSVVVTDQSDPSAPGAGLSALYTKSGALFIRAGASGTPAQVGDPLAAQIFGR